MGTYLHYRRARHLHQRNRFYRYNEGVYLYRHRRSKSTDGKRRMLSFIRIQINERIHAC